jgi:hypothetical protein
MTDINTIADLKQDSRNARKHTPRNVGMIEKSLGEVGAARSIVIDELGNILAGNATVEAAANAGMERVQVVDTDGETIIAVRRTGLTPEQKVRLALYDNRTAELAEWDSEVLAGLVEEGVDLSTFWSPYELGKLGQEVNAEPVDFAAEWKGMPEFEQEDQTPAYTIPVHFANLQDMEEFGRLLGQTVTEMTRFLWYPPAPQQDDHRDRYIDKA